ncbi:hypothetical protein Pcinc_044169 [Petrolisthes cinctipes]|uniref:Uncharacterized protein n=1 Tax=Petrolisthes cinctipes TaxID=88211 RepID=A0AAE1BF44_PETCI|nr:hypothetical protein Pcinc_044169 [Petrolisthes cinctipes]
MPKPKKHVALRRAHAAKAREIYRRPARSPPVALPQTPSSSTSSPATPSSASTRKSLVFSDEVKRGAELYFRLSDEQVRQVKGIYDRLTSNEMMSRCIQGMTQNRNEHLHSRVWRLCPKHRNASKRMVDFATATAVCNYNVGYVNSSLMETLGIEYTTSIDKYLVAKDKAMDTPIRRKMRNKKLKRELEYAAGAF